jgi:threonine dehydratase
VSLEEARLPNAMATAPLHAVDLADIVAARRRIGSLARRTPTMTCRALDERAGFRLVFKCENLQRTGSFKIRGALNAVLALDDGEAARGVVTHSSGNHAQALALAARLRGIPATIVMPENAPMVKVNAVEDLGAEIIRCPATQAAREAASAEAVRRTGGVYVPPYDHPRVIAGQGTIALELLEEQPDLRAIVVPVGGGGMISGIAVATRALRPDVQVVGAEPAQADDAARGKRCGVRQPAATTSTIADGLRTSLGDLTWPIVRDLVATIVTVSEEEIVAAMRLVFERLKLVIEPSAAVGVAVALGGLRASVDTGDGPVAVILCGGNVDLDRLPWQPTSTMPASPTA